MSRPYVQIDAANELATLRHHLDSLLPKLKTLPGLIGLTLNGGLARGYGDHLSEIDVTLYLDTESFSRCQRERTPIPAGITILEGALYDIKFLDFEAEKARDWDHVALWDTSYAEILYDPHDLLQALFAEKLSQHVHPDESEGLLFSCWWYFQLAGDIWIHRDDILQGHHMLNQAMVSLVKVLFIANLEYFPHEKWLFHMSRTLDWTPPDWGNRLSQAMSTGDMTLNSLKHRQKEIETLWDEVDAHLRAQYHPDLPVPMMQKTGFEQLSLLIQKGSLSISEWKSLTGSDVPNGDPFYDIITVEEERISLDREKLLQMEPEAMYAWHYEILRAAVANYHA